MHAFSLLLALLTNAGEKPSIYDVIVKRSVAPAAVDVSQFACKIKTPHGMGSGVNTAKGVVTCLHVVNGENPIEVICGDEKVVGTLVVIDRDYDTALIAVTWAKTHPVAELSKVPAVGDKLKSAGRCKDGTINVEDHDCVLVDKKDVRFTNCSNTGRSGGGLFNADGKLVGIIHGNSVDVEPYTGLARSVPHVERLLSTVIPKVSQASPAAKVQGNCPGGVCPINNAPQYRWRR